MVLAGLAILAAGGCFRRGAVIEGGSYVRLAPLAEKRCTRTWKGTFRGEPITLHLSPELAEDLPGRFLEQLAWTQDREEEDYSMLREGVRFHLGKKLFARVENAPYLYPEPPAREWYLFAFDPQDAYVWYKPNTGLLLLPPGVAEPPDEALRPTLYLETGAGEAGQVHEIVHWLIHDLLTSKKGRLPRWFEEGLCDYGQMQFNRWRTGAWHGDRIVQARLCWSIPAYRRQALRWKDGNEGLFGKLTVAFYPTWTGDVLYDASLGLIAGLDEQLGTFRFKDLLREIFETSPERDRELIALIEKYAGKPIGEVGTYTEEARRILFEELAEKARSACSAEEEPPLFLAPGCLGLFPEQDAEALPLLLDLTRCDRVAVVATGLDGLRFFGRRRLLARVLERLREESSLQFFQELHGTSSWFMAEEFSHDHRRAAIWFGRRAERALHLVASGAK